MAAYFVNLTIFTLALLGSMAAADVANLGYSRYSRPSPTRLQRLEGRPTPYPAAGYRPNREFNLPRDQPLFPLGNQVPQDNKPFQNSDDNINNANNNNANTNDNINTNNDNDNINNNNSNNNFGDDILSEPQQPQLTYGAPTSLRQALQQGLQQQQIQPQSQQFLLQQLQRLQQQRLQQQQLQQQQLQQKQLEQQQQLQQFLQQQQQLQQAQAQAQPQSQSQAQSQAQPQAQQNFNVPYQLYSAPQAERLTQPKPARLTEAREDREDDEDSKPVNNADASMEIETEGKSNEDKKKDAPQAPATIAYYPASAFGFVQPISAAYVAATPTIYQSPYVAASPFAQQPLAFASAPAQLRAW